MSSSIINKFNLAFIDPLLEVGFRKSIITDNLPFIRFFILLVLLFNGMYAVREFISPSDRAIESVVFQVAIVIPFYILLLVFSFLNKNTPRLIYRGIIALFVFTIASQLIMLKMNTTDAINIKSIMIIVLFGAYTFSGILFKHILFFTPILALAIYIFTNHLVYFESVELINIALIYTMTITGLMAINYRIEYQQRMSFYKTTVIQQEDVKLKESYLRINAMNELRKDLISVLAHDVRAPIANLESVLKLIKEEDLTVESAKPILNKIEIQTGSVGYLINDILVWIKSENDEIKIQLSPYDVKETISDLWFIFRHEFIAKKIELILDVHESEVYCHPDMLKSILRNLISNAIKFTPTNGKITISTHLVNHKIVIAIKDEGVGMSENQLKLWHSTFNSDLGTRNEKGIGLGLKICSTLVKSHRSKLQFESELNVGTTISFALDPVNHPIS